MLIKLSQTFNFSFRYIYIYIYDMLSLNNSRFGDDLHLIYPSELEVQCLNVCFLSWLSYWNRQRRRLKTKLCDKRDDFTFPISQPLFHQQQYSTITSVWSLHFTTYMFVSGIVNFWREFSCRGISFSNKVMLLQCWNYRYKNATVIITMWLTVTKYQHLKWLWIFPFLRRSVSFPYHWLDIYCSWLYE